MRPNSSADFHHIARAAAGWREGNMVQVEKLLDDCPPDRRGWEWYYLKRLCHTELLSLSGHTDTVNGVAYSPDGTRSGFGELGRHCAGLGCYHRPGSLATTSRPKRPYLRRGLQPRRENARHVRRRQDRAGVGRDGRAVDSHTGRRPQGLRAHHGLQPRWATAGLGRRGPTCGSGM